MTTAAWKLLMDHAGRDFPNDLPTSAPNHLRNLLNDADRARRMTAEFDGVLFDYARARADKQTLDLLLKLADEAKIKEKFDAMVAGDHVNATENRAVLHMALRCTPDSKRFPVQAPMVWDVLNRVFAFAEKVRSGAHKGCTGKRLVNVVSIGIGGSYLGPEFVHEALRFDQPSHDAAQGRTLRFLANVDPVDVARALDGLDPAETLVVVVSKTFTTAETMLNARTVRKWLVDALASSSSSRGKKKTEVDAAKVCSHHIVAVSADVAKARAFGVEEEHVFGFWDWVGGRYSVCSSVGTLPLALQYGASVVKTFLQGAREMDEHCLDAPFTANLPVLLGLISVWNHQVLGYSTRAVLPYSQALLRFPAHIQQVSMESNGKGVAADGSELRFPSGEIVFGEPGTNGQHSFYQLIHQGRVVPCDFIGVIKSQRDVLVEGEPVSSHDELMSNFFAQPDALARGKTADDLRAEGVPEALVPHKTFKGDRPSVSILLPELDARRVGQLLSLYENQVAVEGFCMGVNSFDQWGVELGKVLATAVRVEMAKARASDAFHEPAKRAKMEVRASETGFNSSTAAMLQRYLRG